VRISTVREVTDRQTDRHTDAGEFYIYPCYAIAMGQIIRHRLMINSIIKVVN